MELVGSGHGGPAEGQGLGRGPLELPHPLLVLMLSLLPVHVLGIPRCTEFEYVPVEDIVVGESLWVQEVAEEQAQVQIVRLVIEPQGAAEVEVC